LRDAQGNNVTTAGITIDAAIAEAGASVTAGNSATTGANGIATFSGLTITLTGSAGAYTLNFTSSGLTGTQATVTMAPFYQISILVHPSGAKKDQVFLTQPSIQVLDGGGNPATVPVTASIFTGAGNLGGTLSVATNTSGQATFTNLSIDHTGSHQVRFSAVGIASIVSNPFVVNP
jgi:hypothetical protein